MKAVIRKLMIIGSAIVLVSLVFLSYFILKYSLDEDLYTTRFSLAYFIVIHSRQIKEFPIINNTTEPVFYYSSGDGSSPSSNGISYSFNGDSDIIYEELYDYIINESFTFDSFEATSIDSYVFRKDNLLFVLYIDTDEKKLTAREFYFHSME